MLKIVDFEHNKLSIHDWEIIDNQSWCILGRNGSGKQYLDQVLTRELVAESAQTCILPDTDKVALISFESQQAVYEHELKMDATDFIDSNDIGTIARDFLPKDKWSDPLIVEFGLTHRLDSGYRQLSTGEGRKLLILKAIFEGVEFLVCDNPFDSLDKDSCLTLSKSLEQLSAKGITVLLMLSNRQDIPKWCQQVASIEDGQFHTIGQLNDVETKKQLDKLFSSPQDNKEWPISPYKMVEYKHQYLVKLNNGKVQYSGYVIFDNMNVSIKPLQHTLITGANGSGKSTLMQLITSDCTQCYSNDIEVLGFKRGSGESIWQIKEQMGIVSSEMHRQYRVNGSLLTVVLSGFHDSIGLYKQPEKHQIELARQWLNQVGLLDVQDIPFQQLSYGEQRLGLIARALVKSPYLLILDEPTQGLDEINRHRVLDFLMELSAQQHSTILLVSHREDEYLPMFKQHIKL